MDTPAEFLDAYECPFYMGIDPGGSGGMALLSSDNKALAFDIPVKKIKRKGGTKTIADHPGIIKLFDEIDQIIYAKSLFVCLEIAQIQVRGKGANAYGAYRVACHYAMWPLFLKDRGYDFMEVNPISWKTKMGLVKLDKDQIRTRTLKLYPDTALTRKQDHDRAEALMLARYRKLIEHGQFISPARTRKGRNTGSDSQGLP